VLVLVLAGIVIGTLLGSCVSLLKYLADPYNQLPAITVWVLRRLASVPLAHPRAILPRGVLRPLPLLPPRRPVHLTAPRRSRGAGARRGYASAAPRRRRRRHAHDRCRRIDQRCRRLDRPARAAPRALPRRPRLQAAPARVDLARRRLPARRRHARAHG